MSSRPENCLLNLSTVYLLNTTLSAHPYKLTSEENPTHGFSEYIFQHIIFMSAPHGPQQVHVYTVR